MGVVGYFTWEFGFEWQMRRSKRRRVFWIKSGPVPPVYLNLQRGVSSNSLVCTPAARHPRPRGNIKRQAAIKISGPAKSRVSHWPAVSPPQSFCLVSPVNAHTRCQFRKTSAAKHEVSGWRTEKQPVRLLDVQGKAVKRETVSTVLLL